MNADTTRIPDGDRANLARLTMKGVGMPVAGLIYWLAVSALLARLPLRSGLIYSFAATGAVFPIGAALTRLAGGDLFAKDRTFTPLGLQLAAIQLFYWPVIVVVFRVAPEWTPFVLAVLFSSHFLPYWWLYRSRAYAVLAVVSTTALCAAVLIAGGPLTRQVPLVTAACYAVACVMLWAEVRALGVARPEGSPRESHA